MEYPLKLNMERNTDTMKENADKSLKTNKVNDVPIYIVVVETMTIVIGSELDRISPIGVKIPPN